MQTNILPLLAIAAFSLGGCGLHTPSMQEIGELKERVGPDKEALIAEIRCELERGVYQAVNDPNFGSKAANGGQSVDWLLQWVVKVDLQITVDDKGTVGPGVTLTTPFGTAAQSFSLGLGLQASTEGQRKEEVGYSYALQELETEVEGQKRSAAHIDPSTPCGANGLFIHGDLAIGDFIHQNIFLARPPGLIPSPFNAFNDQIQFIITYSGNFTPSWKLVRFSVNPSSPFASAARTRTQYLTLTFGPPAPPVTAAPGTKTAKAAPEVQGAPRLNDTAEAVHNASLIGQAVTAAIRIGVTQ
jgi:hypothetical protein